METCSRCLSSDVFTDHSRGDVVCRKCGEVLLSHIMDERSECVMYANDDRDRGDLSRCSAFVSDPLWSSHTTLAGGDKTQREILLKAQERSEERWMVTARSHVDEVYSLIDRLKLPGSVKDQAVVIFRRAVCELGVRKRFSLLAVAAVSLACRGRGSSRTMHELSSESGEDEHSIVDMQTRIRDGLGLDVCRVKPEDILCRMCTKLGLNHVTASLVALTCANMVQRDLMDDHSAQLVVAVAILLTTASLKIKAASAEEAPLPTASDPPRLILSQLRPDRPVNVIVVSKVLCCPEKAVLTHALGLCGMSSALIPDAARPPSCSNEGQWIRQMKNVLCGRDPNFSSASGEVKNAKKRSDTSDPFHVPSKKSKDSV